MTTSYMVKNIMFQVSDDGVIVFDLNTKANTNKPKRFPYEHSVIAPLWHDFDGVQQHYREIAASSGRTDVDELNVSHYENTPIQYNGIFMAVKMTILR